MKAFIDTNVLVYAHDGAEIHKGSVAQSRLEHLEAKEEGVVSTQVFLEFAAVARTKLKLSAGSISAIIRQYQLWEYVRHDADAILHALEYSEQEEISIWDAMLVVAAERARCKILYTEDLDHGQHIQGIKIINPFV